MKEEETMIKHVDLLFECYSEFPLRENQAMIVTESVKNMLISINLTFSR